MIIVGSIIGIILGSWCPLGAILTIIGLMFLLFIMMFMSVEKRLKKFDIEKKQNRTAPGSERG